VSFHADVLTVSPDGVEMTPERDGDWGFGSVLKPVRLAWQWATKLTGAKSVENRAVHILGAHDVMAISTLRPDGWPQTTFVGYTNDNFSIYFSIFRSSQKFANISGNDRVSIAVRNDATDLRNVEAVYAGAHATEVTEARERQHAWQLLQLRHPKLRGFEPFDISDVALMRADCKYVSVLDYPQGLGHTETFTINDDGTASPVDSRKDEWGSLTPPP
jgi:nitroimidazol reductase NimA-like FMN-containing flavoprotein (pyridoxamine 5'-phosphate oxidase superfamily)